MQFWAPSTIAGAYYDPLWWFYRTWQRDTLEQVISQHQVFARQADLRPPLTWGHYQQWLRGKGGQIAGLAPFAYGFDSFVKGKGKKFVTLSGADFQRYAGARQGYEEFIFQRAQFERGGAFVERGGPVFFNFPPGHGGVPPGQWKKFGGVTIPPGQLKKMTPAIPGPPGVGPVGRGGGPPLFKGKGGSSGKGGGKGGKGGGKGKEK